jgi:hypothetical protein
MAEAKRKRSRGYLKTARLFKNWRRVRNNREDDHFFKYLRNC